MREKKSEFPWFLFYVPVITVVMMQWCSDIIMGDDSVDIFETFLEWLGLSKDSTLTLILIAASLAAVCFTVARLLSANKDLKEIGETAKTAPAELSAQMSGVEKNICERIDTRVLIDLTEIKSSTSAVQRQIESISRHSNDVPVQQSSMLSSINNLYFLIEEKSQRIKELETKNLQLIQENQQLRKALQKTRHLDRGEREPEL